jgi:hypothetical protein
MLMGAREDASDEEDYTEDYAESDYEEDAPDEMPAEPAEYNISDLDSTRSSTRK